MSARRGPFLTIADLSHSFGASRALADISLDVETGELIALLGPSGCGKTTLLKMIAGFLTPDKGNIWFEGSRMNEVPANRRQIGMVFQNYALFPHMSVAQNIAYGLRARRAAAEQIREKVREMLALVQLDAFADRFPAQLSGGQQQRVALARALAIDPQIILLDEPFSALDKNLRLDMQIEIKRLIKSYGVTTIMVTHDQEEALSMADRVVVMNAGRIEQTAAPQVLYDRPASVFVNNFIGHTNFLRGTVLAEGRVRLQSGLDIDLGTNDALPQGSDVLVSVRPENLVLAPVGSTSALEVEVRIILPLGSTDIVETRTASGEAIRLSLPRAQRTELPAIGSSVRLAIADTARIRVFPGPATPTTLQPAKETI